MNDMYRSFVSGFCSHDNIEVSGSGVGPLVGLNFAVKDIIDVAGQTTGAGNPDWYHDHQPAKKNARVVQQLLDAGANMVGKTITEEFAYGLIGENYHYGTPINPRVAGGVPGGSSSGSASVVASGQADFALGTDTGGSVRVPASFCGLYGIRPSHGRVSLTGIMPLAPSLDTCGWFARDANLLRTIGTVLLEESLALAPQRVLLAEDAFDLADAEVRQALESAITRVQERYGEIQVVRPSEMPGLQGYDAWQSAIQVTRGSEAAASHLAWMRSVDAKMGPGFRDRFEAGEKYTHAEIADAMSKRSMVEGYMA
ncbi:MAG: amidase family protein, partial [Alphaproteobacteria bacterium]|nr:amidase family protein [Alphaproteobacteria bacterium]